MNVPLIQVDNLSIRYGNHVAVNNVSFQVQSGETLGILGSNGAGKSSTLKVLACVNPLTSGRVLVGGYDVSHPRDVESAKKVLGYCPDVGGLIKTATIREHIGITLALHDKLHLWKQALELVERFNLLEFLDTPCADFSHGMSRRLSVILAVVASQQALILDEPYDGVDPLGADTTKEVIKEASEAGLSTIISTHLQSLLVESSDRVLIMRKGEVMAEDSADKFKGQAGTQRYREILEQ